MAKKQKQERVTYEEFESAVDLCLKAIIRKRPDIEPALHADHELRNEKKALETAYEMMSASLDIFLKESEVIAENLLFEARGIARVYNALPDDDEFTLH